MKVNPSFELLKSLPSLQFSLSEPPAPSWSESGQNGPSQDLSLTTWFLISKLGFFSSWSALNLSVVLQLGDDVTDIPQDPLLLAVAIYSRKKNWHPPKKNKQFTAARIYFRNTTSTAWNHQFHNQKKPSQKSRFHHDFFESTLCGIIPQWKSLRQLRGVTCIPPVPAMLLDWKDQISPCIHHLRVPSMD